MLMELFMKVNGLMIFNMEKEKKAGKMVLFSKVCTTKARNTEQDTTAGTMEVNILVTGTRIKSMDSEPTVGQMEDNIKAIGSKITWKTWVFILGQTVDATWVNIKMTRNTDMVFTSGQMAACTQANGCAASNMASESIRQQILISSTVSGKRASVQNGSRTTLSKRYRQGKKISDFSSENMKTKNRFLSRI